MDYLFTYGIIIQLHALTELRSAFSFVELALVINTSIYTSITELFVSKKNNPV